MMNHPSSSSSSSSSSSAQQQQQQLLPHIPSHPKPKRVLRIALEGNIAAGKSTFLDILSRELDVVIIPEPVSRWTSVADIRDDPTSAKAFEELTVFQGGGSSSSAITDADAVDGGSPATDKDKRPLARSHTPLLDFDNSNTLDSIPPSQDTGGNLLSLFYSSPNRWSFTFQMYACLSRIRAQMRPAENPHPQTIFIPRQQLQETSRESVSDPLSQKRTIDDVDDAAAGELPRKKPALEATVESEDVYSNVHFTERSVFSDRYCFALNCSETKLMTKSEFAIYQEWHSFMELCVPEAMRIDGIVYLRSTPQTCLHRLQKRGRDEESTVGLHYLEQLHMRHEDWLIHKKAHLKLSPLSQCPMLVVDSDREFQCDSARCQEMVAQVREFMEKCHAHASGAEKRQEEQEQEERV